MSNLSNQSSDQLIDSIMGFDPTNLNAFKEPTSTGDPCVYKTSPKLSKSEDGIYRSKVKILLNPFSPQDSIVHQASYYLQSADGNRLVRSSLGDGDKNCPLFRAWKSLWFSGDEAKKDFSKTVYDKSESNWVLVQVLEDENQPEMVGKFRVMKLAKIINEKLIAKMNPSDASKQKPYPVMDYLIGLTLDLEVQPGPDDPAHPERKQRETSYSLSQFGDYAPVIKTDGTPLLTEAEIELVDTYVEAINAMENGKTQKKRDDGKAMLTKVRPQIRPIYAKVIKYVEENLKTDDGEKLDLKKHCGYTPWDENTVEFVNHFTEMTGAGVDPKSMTYAQFKASQGAVPVTNTQPTPETPQPEAPAQPEEDDDLPF